MWRVVQLVHVEWEAEWWSLLDEVWRVVQLVHVEWSGGGNVVLLESGSVLPDEQPKIEGDIKGHYLVGNTVNLNCTSAPSVPAAHLV
ncbi:hypothetical protein Pcinc_007300 [Petrolisthes cinctipes]|uniref:Uncharacterized protein n=1 Tax=Petrolisthes cinctipes TaxID=88211 RepID=A0AAE1GB77_PETCI|nr:hypothetical protein Pcinc_007300 [Petrolisthes cinctipes]